MLKTLREDVRRGDFRRSLKRDYKELKDFMLDEQRKKRLSEMGRWRRWLYNGWWLFKSLFFKLTPPRRILLVIGLVLIMITRTITFSGESLRISSDTNGLGVLCILFVLGLELKDKLVARKELEAGRAIQEALKPEQSPSVPGWELWLYTRSANEVSGDLVDFIRIDDNRFGVVLADVAGKGLRAALLAAKLQATMRAIVPDVRSLSLLASRVNTFFFRDSPPSIFASLLFAEVRPDSGIVRFVNAGHIPPFVMRDEHVDAMEKGGVALGIMSDASFVEGEVTLEMDDTLVIFSDGVSEARNNAGEFFGSERIKSFLRMNAGAHAAEIGEQLVHMVEAFVGDATVHDDLSIIVLKRSKTTS
jgi:sigma-B regulation protein RsbU (phosphoserine phosphatase)